MNRYTDVTGRAHVTVASNLLEPPEPEHLAFYCATCGNNFDLIVRSQEEIDECLRELGCLDHDFDLASYEPAP